MLKPDVESKTIKEGWATVREVREMDVVSSENFCLSVFFTVLKEYYEKTNSSLELPDEKLYKIGNMVTNSLHALHAAKKNWIDKVKPREYMEEIQKAADFILLTQPVSDWY